MSAGPIAQERRGHVAAAASVPKSVQLHAFNDVLGRAHCGRAKVAYADGWARVSCPDCQAARRADEAAS